MLMKYTNQLLTVILMIFSSACLMAQQRPQASHFSETRQYWNPAMTGQDQFMRTDVFFRQQWLGFAGAPTTAFINLQYPFIDMNMSAGAAIEYDQTGPVNKTGLRLNYAYHLNGFLGEEARLSLGIDGGLHQYAFNPNGEIFNDEGDILLTNNSNTSFYPSIGFGAFYQSNVNEYDENVLYFGMAYRDAFTTDVLVNDQNQDRARHLFLNIGTRVYGYDSYIEPNIIINYVSPEIVDIMVNAKYEMRDLFWMGLGYSSVNDLAFQGGFIFDEFGSRYGKLRVGALGNVNITDKINEFGPGFEFFMSYMYDID